MIIFKGADYYKLIILNRIIYELSNWYWDQMNDANEFWRVESVSPQEAPQVNE